MLLGQLAWRENKNIFRFDQVECLVLSAPVRLDHMVLFTGQIQALT